MTDELSLLAARREELRQQAVCFKRSCDVSVVVVVVVVVFGVVVDDDLVSTLLLL